MPDRSSQLAGSILEARRGRHCIPALTGPDRIADDEAYLVQQEITAARLARGEQVAGWKLGYTSAAMREQMGIADPNFGPLTDVMLLPTGAYVPGDVIHPKVEPEIALVMGADVVDGCSPQEIRAFVVEARAALEVVDSIWCDYRFSWADNTADGSSAAYAVIGPVVPMEGLPGLPLELRRNGLLEGTGVGANAMGDPFVALSWLSHRLAAQGALLRAGDVVITGGLCRAIDLEPGDLIGACFLGDQTWDVTVRRGDSGSDLPATDGSLDP